MLVFLLLMAREMLALITTAVPWSLKTSSAFNREGWTHISTTNFYLSQMWISTCTAGKESVYFYASSAAGGNVVQWIGIYFPPVILFVTLGKTLYISLALFLSPLSHLVCSVCLNSKAFQARTICHLVFVSCITKRLILFTWAYGCCCNINSTYLFILLS